MEPIRVHSYESMGIFDGPGIRLVVFLQSCNFKCLYCANPDTIALTGGKEEDPLEILRMAKSQKAFFGKKGGVTFSGGEPMMQAKALLPLCKLLREEGINVCIDTNGSLINNTVMELINNIDMVLLDIKEINSKSHEILTNHSNANTLRLARMLEERAKPFRVRYVLVPGYSDSKDDLIALGEFLKDFKCLDRLEILPYHTFGKHKYESLNWEYKLEGVAEPSDEQVSEVVNLLKQYVTNVWTQ